MDVYLIDGTYELFRHYYALPSARERDGREVAAVRGVLESVLGMIHGGTTHVGVATDHVIESFRNRLWPGYKTGGPASSRTSLLSSNCSKTRCPRWASRSGRWSSTRPMTPWRPRRPRRPATRASIA